LYVPVDALQDRAGGRALPPFAVRGTRRRLIYLGFAAKFDASKDPANIMDERRKHPRTEINQPGYVSSGGSVMSCVVRNISPEGAAIDVENPAFVPERFRLVIADGGAVYECRIAWIQKNRIGLNFVDAT
jgi:hypothetical protein